MIQWVRAGDTAIKSHDGRFHICKNNLSDPVYMLYDRSDVIGVYDDPQDAKSMAETLKENKHD